MARWHDALLRLVERKTGIVLSPPQLVHVDGVLRTRASATGHADVRDYLRSLEGEEFSSEFESVVDLVTVGKTSFFRHPSHVEAVVEKLVPIVHEALPPGQPIRIWSAACSSGEEPYTVAMALDRDGWFDERPIEIYATDISRGALTRAHAARYHPDRVELLKLPPFAQKYLEADGNYLRVKRFIRNSVTFAQLNLSSFDHAAVPKADIILCCNVLIYFSSKTVDSIIRALHGALSPMGALLFGGAEAVQVPPDLFEVYRWQDAYLQLKGDWGEGTTDFEPIARSRVGVEPEKPESGGAKRRRGRRPTGVPVDQWQAPEQDEHIAQRLSLALERATRQAKAGQRSDAIETLRQVHFLPEQAPELTRLLATLLLDSGHYEEAAEAFEGACEADPFAFDLHFFQGQALKRLERWEEAQKAFRKVTFLEPSFAFAYYELATCLHSVGDFTGAVQHYERAERAETGEELRETLAQNVVSRESFWMNDSFVAALSKENRQRAQHEEPAVDSSSPPNEESGE